MVSRVGPIPTVGFGVYQAPPGETTKAAVLEALRAGYRHIDTAQIYRNEKDVGEAVRESGIPREEVWVTTKVWTGQESSDGNGFTFALEAVRRSLKALGLDYIDMILLHSPHFPGERVQRWKGLEEAQKLGLVKHIGVSNYGIVHLKELFANSTVRPLVNQIEVHAFLSRVELVRFCQANNVIVEAYSPLAKASAMTNPTLLGIAGPLGRSVAQVMLRYLIQRGLVVLPKSVNPKRIKENFDVFSFELSEAQMNEILALDEGRTTGWDPTTGP